MAGYFLKNDFTPSTSSTYTVSFWIKINNFLPTSINVPYVWSIGQSGQQTSGMFFQADTTPYNIGFYNGANGQRYMPTNYMRDTNAWYHVHLKVSSGTGTLYYNGESVKTSIVVPAQNSGGVGNTHAVHTYVNDPAGYDNLECVMSHFHFVDGTAYDPTVFGETDSTTGEWKIKTSPSVTYGTNGYFILKDGNTGTDQSPNTNNFTLTGTCTKTEDCPSNVFATANPLDVMKQSGGIYQPTFSNGNLTISCNSATNYQTFGTIAVDTGKYYWETKATDVNGHRVGVFFGDNKVHSGTYYYGTNAFYIHQNGQIYYNGANTVYMSSLSDGDIVGVALDRTNGHIYLHKNGQYADGNGNNDQTFANAVSISTKLGVTMPSDITYPFFDVYGTSAVMDINFGNGYFGTTAVSSAGTNASGNGIFEYDVPTGFTALSTKGLNL